MAAARTSPSAQLTAEALKADSNRSESAHTSSSSLKRKRGTDLKFYAVRAGHKPGIYHNWADCKAQVTGFKKAVYKSFTSLTDAQAFMKSGDNNSSSTGAPKKFYAVQNGREPGVYTDWPSAQKQITGWTKPKHRSFSTRAEADAFVKAGKSDGVAVPNVSVDDAASSIAPTPARDTDSPAPSKKAKNTKKETAASKVKALASTMEAVGTMELGWDPLPGDAEDGFDRRIIMDPDTGKIRWKTEEELNAMKLMPKTGEKFAETLQVWTDGACQNNGKKSAVAGVGVYFGKDDPRNVSEPLPGLRQTNQRAELTALKRALAIAPLNRNVLIFSDSHYSIQCLTTWFQKWRVNGYQTASRKPVENKDLIEECLKLIEERHVCGVKTDFRWVKGHGSDEGNEAADRLAVRGAEEARRISANGGTVEMANAEEELELGLGIGGLDGVLGFGDEEL